MSDWLNFLLFSLIPPRPAQPGPPVVSMATTDSSITLTWNTTLMCFESEMFNFVVIWSKIGSLGTNTSTTVLSPPYTISGLQPDTSYEVSVHGVSRSGVVGERRVLTVTTTGEEELQSYTQYASNFPYATYSTYVSMWPDHHFTT